jgi:hypothetical protein
MSNAPKIDLRNVWAKGAIAFLEGVSEDEK